MHRSIQGANSVLIYSFEKDALISPLKLQKLVYFIHGWYLANFDEPTFEDSPEVWEYGPVFSEIYHDYKIFGSLPINENAWKEYGPLWKGKVEKEDGKFHAILEAVWEVYASRSAMFLSDLTHQPGTPWSLANDRGDPYLSQEEIKKHFKQLMPS